jgi:ankyrin repeat protein
MASAITDTFLDAVKNNKLEVVKTLIAVKDSIGLEIDAKNSDGWTALITASCIGQKEIVEIILKNKADIEAKDLSGWTALMWASYHGRKEIVELLLKNGAEINAKNSHGWTALMYASACVSTTHKEIIKILKDAAAKAKTEAGSKTTVYTIRVPPGIWPKIIFDATATEITVSANANAN